MTESRRALRVWLSASTLLFLCLYVPLETYVTLSIAGFRGLTYSSYLMNLCGMALMLWGVLAVRADAPHGGHPGRRLELDHRDVLASDE